MHATSPDRHPVSGLSTLLALVAVALAGCGDDGAGPGETVSLSPGTVSLFVGETRQLAATVSGSSNGSVTFSSSNDQVATVAQSGLVTAVGLGTATVTAATSGGQASATAAVTVNPSTVTAAPTAVELEVGETAQLTATVQGGVGLGVSWSSADETVATVGDDGEVLGEGVGVTTVTASVDGQPGVQADVEVTVTEVAPDLILENITTLDGSAIDPGSVSGVIVFDFTVSGPAGLTGEVDVLFGDQVAATAPVSLSPAATASGPLMAAGPLAGPLAGSQMGLTVPVSTISAELVEGVGQMKFPAGLTEATARLRLGGGTVPVRIRGSEGSTTSLNIRGQVVAIVEPVDEAEPITGQDGDPWTSGGLSFRGWLAHHPGVTPPTDVTLGLDLGGNPYEASAAVTGQNFHVDLFADDPYPAGLGGFAGRVELLGIRDQDQNAFPLANTYPPDFGFYKGWEIRRNFWKDNVGPVYGGPPFEVPAPYWMGGDLELTDHLKLVASYDPDAWQDPGVGLDACEWRAGFVPGTYPIGGSTSDDWPQTSGRELYVAKTCWDLFGRETHLPLNHPVGVDLVPPDVWWAAGSANIADFSVNPFADAVVRPTGLDPIPDGLTGSSGMDLGRWELSLSYASPTSTPESGCIRGLFQDGMCQTLPMPTPWSDGFLPDRLAGAGEYLARYALFDAAGNQGQGSVRWIDDTTPPVVGAITYDPESFVPGSPIEFSANVTDNVEIWRASPGLRYAGLDYAFLGESVPVGTPYDGTFANAAQVVTTYSSYFEAVQTTSSTPPHGPTGDWYKLTGALFGAQDTGFNIGTNYVFLDHLTSAPTGTLTAVDGHYLVPGPAVLGVPAGGTCTVPTQGTYGVELFIPGNAATGPTLNVDAARLFAVERLALAGSTENVAYPVSSWLAPEVFDFGTYRAAYFESVVNPSVGPMPEGETELFWHFRLPDNRQLQSQSFTAEVRYCF